MKYRFLITEYLRKSVVVEAETKSEAEDKLYEQYDTGMIVLSADDYDCNEVEFLEETNDEADIR